MAHSVLKGVLRVSRFSRFFLGVVPNTIITLPGWQQGQLEPDIGYSCEICNTVKWRDTGLNDEAECFSCITGLITDTI